MNDYTASNIISDMIEEDGYDAPVIGEPEQFQKVVYYIQGLRSQIKFLKNYVVYKQSKNTAWAGPKVAQTLSETVDEYLSGNGIWQWESDGGTWDDDTVVEEPKVTVMTCECGSEKAGIPGHSPWCPKREKN